jgi:hypothetical protein
MRLGQLARKLALRPAEIIEFLAANNIQMEENANAKVEDSHLSLILLRFAPDMLNTISSEADIPETSVESAEIIANESDVTLERSVVVDSMLEEIEAEEKVEVIKAPKVELSGLKVVGKIDLPESKKKSEPTQEIESVTEAPKIFETKENNSNFKKHQSNKRPAKNPITLEREREALEYKKKREEEAKLQKEKRTQNYLKKVKSPQPTKAVRLLNEPVEEMSAAELAEPPKTWWGKFVRWLTT